MSRMNKSALSIGTILIQTFFMVMINYVVFFGDDLRTIKQFLPYANILILILGVMAVVSIRSIEKIARKQILISVLKEHISQVESLLVTLRAQKHEHTRHIQTILSMLYLDEINKAKEYLEEIIKNFWQSNEPVLNTGNPVLTALFDSKAKAAEVKGIKLAASVKCDVTNIPVNSEDLCSIIGNLLDNAMEAAITDEEVSRVGLEIKYERNSYIIAVNNNGTTISEGQVSELFKPGYSTKNSMSRGYGLFIVQNLVKSYDGKIEVVTGDKTTFLIYIPDNRRVISDKSAF